MKSNLIILVLICLLPACGLTGAGSPSGVLDSSAEPGKGVASAQVKPGGSGAKCQSHAEALERAERLVVRITTKYTSGAPTAHGAGILLSVQGSTAYILTANHVVDNAAAGKPAISVVFDAPGGAAHTASAIAATRYSWPRDLYPEVAVIQADLRQTGRIAPPQWDILRDSRDRSELKDVIAIGNPAGRAKTVTPKGDAELRSARELRLNSGVMEQGYSGGAVFDAQKHLAGLVIEDSGQYAAAYPIEPVLAMLKTAGVPVDLVSAPAAKKNIYLKGVAGNTPELEAAGRIAISAALQEAGFEPACTTSGSYKLSVQLKGVDMSGTSTAVEMEPAFEGPGGEPFQIEKMELSFIHMIGYSPLSSTEALEKKMRDASGSLVKILSSKMQRP
jgi:hypothetical protein